MKTKMIEVRLYEKGDRVMTPMGAATVMETEVIETESEYQSRLVRINHDGNIDPEAISPADPDVLMSLDDWEARNNNPSH